MLITPETKQTWREAREECVCGYVYQTHTERKRHCYGRSVILNKLQALLTDEKDTKTLVRRRTVIESEIFLTVYEKINCFLVLMLSSIKGSSCVQLFASTVLGFCECWAITLSLT